MNKIKKIFAYLLGNPWYYVSSAIENNHHSIEIILTALALIVAYNLFTETQREVKNSSDALRIADSSLDLTQKNSIIENRAWVGLVREPSRISGDLDIWNVRGNIQNFGKTPAESARISLNYFPSGKKLVLRRLMFEPPRVISPSQSIDFNISFESHSEDTTQRVYKNEMVMYMHGFVTYKDVYGGRDTTEFLFYLDTIPNVPKLIPVSGHNWMK